MSFVALGQVPLLMLKAITATRSQGLDGRSQDVRDSVRVARLAPQLGVKRAISLLLPRGGEGGYGIISIF